MYINFEKIGENLRFGKEFFYNLKVKQNLKYIEKNQKKVLKKLRNKTPLNVIFYVYDESKWKSQSVYDLMEKDERFNPLIVVTKNCAVKENANYQTIEDVKKCFEFFKNKGMNVEYGYKMIPHPTPLLLGEGENFTQIKKNITPIEENITTTEETFIPFEKFNPDIIFYSHPWYVYKTQGPVICSKFALTYYIPYFIPASEQWHEYSLRFHKYLYRHYVPTDIINEYYSKKGKLNNIKTVGHPIFDNFKNQEQKDKKHLIYAPHWTVCGDNLRFGTFNWNGKKILDFAKNHPELNWVFRPHPLFYKFILASKFMTKNEIDNYYNEWKEFAIVSEGGDYINLFKESYAMITDCGSFLTEYFISENPVIHLISDSFKGNNTVNKIDETYYTAHSIEELNQHLNEVILNKNDYKKQSRQELLEQLNLKNSSCAEKIINDIINDLRL